MEEEMEHMQKRLHQIEAEKEQSDEFGRAVNENEIILKKSNSVLKKKVLNLQNAVDMKNELVISATYDLSLFCLPAFMFLYSDI